MKGLSREEAVGMVLDGLQTLILLSANSAAGEQHVPRADADASDDFIADRVKQMRALREMRREFEDLVTEVIDHPTVWLVEAVCGSRLVAQEVERVVRQALEGRMDIDVLVRARTL